MKVHIQAKYAGMFENDCARSMYQTVLYDTLQFTQMEILQL